MQIKVTLSRDRRQLGRLRLLEGDIERFSCLCYSKADSLEASRQGNPSRDPTRRNGDTPTGKYEGIIDPPRLPTDEAKRLAWLRKFGKWQAIRLSPISGDALTAHSNGRRGLLIHGGNLSPHGSLLETSHGLRIEDKDQMTLVQLLKKANAQTVSVEIEEI